ncbi:MAG: hypothetical protein M0R74_15485 [Dehalococcoidia bacterium]|nr:hypothetical protein [Candidatus Neomarinimicrobiota bacterium]MCK9520406.1 hypothetical protein [Dehalococcoidia bacterium]
MKIRKLENFRVIVIPADIMRIYFSKSDDSYRDEKRTCHEIVDNIKRHIDDVEDVYMDFETKEICSFCERIWEEDDTGCPVCCQDAIDEYEKSKMKIPGESK